MKDSVNKIVDGGLSGKQSPPGTSPKIQRSPLQPPPKPQQVSEQQQARIGEQQLVNDLLREDKEEVGRYILNLLADIRGLRQQNRKLKKENQLNSLVEDSYKSDLNESLKQYTEKIKRLEERNRELQKLAFSSSTGNTRVQNK